MQSIQLGESQYDLSTEVMMCPPQINTYVCGSGKETGHREGLSYILYVAAVFKSIALCIVELCLAEGISYVISQSVSQSVS